MDDFSTPAAEFEVTADLVAALVREQLPKLADEPITPLSSGWDNTMFRVGEHHIARLPRRSSAVPLMINEQLVLPTLANQLPVPIPRPLHVGEPAQGYPWPWSIVPWLPGQIAADAPLQPRGALELAECFASLHNIDTQTYPSGTTPNPVRGVPLAERADAFEVRAVQMADNGEPLTPAHEAIWRDALDASTSANGVIIHGDPHGRNVLTQDGGLAALIDWGDISVGDAASDVAGLWALIHDDQARREAVTLYLARAKHGDAVTMAEVLIARAKGWALLYGVMLRVTGLTDNATHARLGAETLRNVLH